VLPAHRPDPATLARTTIQRLNHAEVQQVTILGGLGAGLVAVAGFGTPPELAIRGDRR
jgi:hypothetical protein